MTTTCYKNENYIVANCYEHDYGGKMTLLVRYQHPRYNCCLYRTTVYRIVQIRGEQVRKTKKECANFYTLSIKNQEWLVLYRAQSKKYLISSLTTSKSQPLNKIVSPGTHYTFCRQHCNVMKNLKDLQKFSIAYSHLQIIYIFMFERQYRYLQFSVT